MSDQPVDSTATDPNVDVQGEQPTTGDGGPCPQCGSATRRDHNGFDICTFTDVPKEHCQATADDVRAATS